MLWKYWWKWTDLKYNLKSLWKSMESCTICIVLIVIAFLIIIGISSAYFYLHWYLKSSNIHNIKILVRSVFQEGNQYIDKKTKSFLDECLYKQ